MSVLNKFARIVYFRKIRIQICGKLKLLLATTIGVILLLAMEPATMAATQVQINTAITAGVAWLAPLQQAGGNWPGSYAADTGFALAALEHYAEKLGYTPLDPTYAHATRVQNGLNYLFSSATYDAGNSWVYWDVGGNNSYQTGPCLMAIARSGAPTATVSGGALNGKTYLQVAQMAVDWLGSAQITSGDGTGAWYYTKGSTTGDQSATGWVTMGLGYAAHSMGCTLPAGLLTRLATWNEFIQWHTAGPDFGGAAYMSSYLGWYNVYKTGHLLFAQGLCGSTVATQRVLDALTFMNAHWADLTNGANSSNDYGWRGNPPGILPSYIATAAASKGFTELEIETFNGHDWYFDFADVIVTNQHGDGSWLGGGHGEDAHRSTCWALLTLLRATSHFPPMVTTNAADNIGPSTATLHGNMTDMGTATTVDLTFQYGTISGSYAFETTAEARTTVPYAYSAAISGLTLGTRYYFRAKAVGDATGYGDELFFDTLTVLQYQVGFLCSANGHLGGNLAQVITQGQDCTPVTAFPDLGYRLQGWSGDYSGSDNPLTIRNVTANMNIRAVFTNDPPQVTIVSPADGGQAYGVMTVRADVTDDTRIAGVEFYVDGKLQEQGTARKPNNGHRFSTGEQKEFKNALLGISSWSSGVHSSSESSQYVFTWNAMNFSVDNHVLRVVAYDDANASGADQITVKVAKVKLDLLAERREAQAFSILRQYGQIQFLVENFGIPVVQYRILRRKGAGDFELLKTVTPTELQNNQFQMQDKYLEENIT
ncbi:MAG: Ig-like domain-containing protein, partial [Candidatus Aminicenantes bacterium]|nr:Ig-like domain-containing protein [Candidatus Aminicenantes bacterium]